MRREDEDIATRLKKSLPSAKQEEEVGKRVFYRLLLAQTESPITTLPNEKSFITDRKPCRTGAGLRAKEPGQQPRLQTGCVR